MEPRRSNLGSRRKSCSQPCVHFSVARGGLLPGRSSGAPSARGALGLVQPWLLARSPALASPSPRPGHFSKSSPAKAWASCPGASSFLMRAGPTFGTSQVICLHFGTNSGAHVHPQHRAAFRGPEEGTTCGSSCWERSRRGGGGSTLQGGRGLPSRRKWTKRQGPCIARACACVRVCL